MISVLPITICFTYFRSLQLANLRASLYAIRQQDESRVEAIVFVDNNTADSFHDIQKIIDDLDFPTPFRVLSYKHGDETRTHSWSTNVAVFAAVTPWILFCRADYIIDFDLTRRFTEILQQHPDDWDGFVTANVFHLGVDVGAVEATPWRQEGTNVLRTLPGVENDYTAIDAGVWMARRHTFSRVQGLDESLTRWGHAQTHFQHKLFEDGVEFVRIPEPLFYHPQHAGDRDINIAHAQLSAKGISLKEMWRRYEGVQPYS